MFSTKSLLVGLFLLCFAISSSGQTTVKEGDYTIYYQGSTVTVSFDKAVSIDASDAFTGKDISIHATDLNRYVLEDVTPAAIIKLHYQYLDGKATVFKTSYIATASLSTGTINVYFNHPVNTAFAQTQNAVNLGNTLDDMLISYINACTTTLDIAIYNSDSPSGTTGIAGAINAAYNRGVQVRVIYDGSTSSAMIPLLNSGIPTLASPTGVNYGIMHNKFVVFDAAVSDANIPVVWTGSTNWTVAQIDGPDKNSAIVIQDQALALGYKIEFEEMWGSNTLTPNATLSKFGPFKTDNTPHSYVIGGKVVNSYFSPSDGANSKIITAINSANSDVSVATMLITRSDISTALINKFNSGVTNVNIVLDSQNPASNQLSTLQSGLGTNHVVSYTGSGIMHHKFMVVDNFNSASDPQVLVGSHNWSTSAETKNDENMLIVHDANIANQYYQAFAYLFQLAGGTLSTTSTTLNRDDLVLYPNPTTGLVYFSSRESSELEGSTISVYDVLGTRILEKHSDHLTTEVVDLSGQASGVYLVRVSVGGKEGFYKVVRF